MTLFPVRTSQLHIGSTLVGVLVTSHSRSDPVVPSIAIERHRHLAESASRSIDRKTRSRRTSKAFIAPSSSVNTFHYDVIMALGHGGAASGGQLEEKVDWKAETDQKIPQAESLAKAGQLSEALALLANLEKKCRVGNDNPSLVRVCTSSLLLCSEAKDVDALISTLETLSTRRSQKTAAVRALVQTALPWCVVEPYEPIAVTNDVEKKNRNRLVMCLRDITDGKIFLEKERAQLTRAMSKIKV